MLGDLAKSSTCAVYLGPRVCVPEKRENLSVFQDSVDIRHTKANVGKAVEDTQAR